MRRFFLGLSDCRLQELTKILVKKGEIVYDYKEFFDDIKSGDIVVLSPAYKYALGEIEKLPKGVLIFGPKVDFVEGKKCVDLMELEDFVIDNAMLTAENFLAELIINTKTSIYEQDILILGNGRIAKALWHKFSLLGVKFDVGMRRIEEKNLSRLVSKNSFLLKELPDILKNYDVIINTIPSVLFEDDNNFRQDAVLFELASSRCLVKNDKVKYILCPALPAKYSPKSAGMLILGQIENYLKGEDKR